MLTWIEQINQSRNNRQVASRVSTSFKHLEYSCAINRPVSDILSILSRTQLSPAIALQLGVIIVLQCNIQRGRKRARGGRRRLPEIGRRYRLAGCPSVWGLNVLVNMANLCMKTQCHN